MTPQLRGREEDGVTLRRREVKKGVKGKRERDEVIMGKTGSGGRGRGKERERKKNPTAASSGAFGRKLGSDALRLREVYSKERGGERKEERG